MNGKDNSRESERKSHVAKGDFRGDRTPNRGFSRKLSSKGRRGFLSLLGSIGISAASIRGLSREVLADEDYSNSVPFTAKYRVRDIERLRNRDPGERLEVEAVAERTPRDEWARNRAVRNAADNLRSKFGKGSERLRVGIGTNSAGKQVVEVRYSLAEVDSSQVVDSLNSLPDTVSAEVGRGKGRSPERFENIPVRTRGAFYQPQACDNPGSYDANYTEVPGGAMATFKEGGTFGTEGGTGTTATPVYSNDRSEYVMLTAGHNFEDPDISDTLVDVHQPCEAEGDICGSHIQHGDAPDYKMYADYDGNGVEGWTRYSMSNLDAGTFSPVNGHSTEYSLADRGSGYDELIGGYLSMETIEQGVGTINMTKQGTTTGRKKGVIEYVDTSAKWFATEAYTEFGDSGGPHFTYESSNNLDDVNIAGVHSVRVFHDGSDQDIGSGAYALERILSEYNLSFI